MFVIPEYTLNDLVCRVRSMLLVGQSIDVGSETRGGRCIDAGNMMVDTGLKQLVQDLPLRIGAWWYTCFVGFRTACFNR